MTSVRRQLLLGSAAATIAIFLAAAATLYFLARHFLVSEFDAGLRTRIQAIASMTEFDPLENRLDAEDAEQLPEFRGGSAPEYFEISSDDRAHVVLSATLAGKPIDRTAFPREGASVAAFMRLPDGRAGRAMMYRARTRPDEQQASARGPDVTIIVAKSTASLDRMLARLRTLLTVVCGVATVALLGLCAWTITRAMRPVRQLAARIGAIRADELGEQLPACEVPQELGPIVARLNELLTRLNGAFERERAFTADAAHELRTPLSGLQTALEVCGRERREATQYQRVVTDCLAVVRQMNTMVDNLLLLARADGEHVPVAHVTFELGDLLRETWARQQRTADERKLRVRLDAAEGLEVRSDRDKLAMILSNLLENAVRYVNDAGDVTIRASHADGVATIEISNTGSRVRREDAERVFDRFWRGDASRSSSGRNCGLGLAVCRKLASVLGASLVADCSQEGIFLVRIELAGTSRAADKLQPACA